MRPRSVCSELLCRCSSQVETRPIHFCVFFLEAAKDDFARQFTRPQPRERRADSDLTRFGFRISVGPRGDARKSDCDGSMLRSQLQGRPVARREKFTLTVFAAFPYWAHGMDYELGREQIALRDPRLSLRAMANLQALVK